MSVEITNVRIERNTDFITDERPEAINIVAFDLDGSSSLEYLDGDGMLCAEHDSNLRNYLPHDEADEVRERLAVWLAGPSHRVRWVSSDDSAELRGWAVPHGGDIAAVKATCLREILDQCSTDEERAETLAGTIEVTPVAA